jgi:UDP-N-acetylmuramate dehydrogenase
MMAQQKLQGRLLANEPMARYTSWRVGGPAEHLYIPAG